MRGRDIRDMKESERATKERERELRRRERERAAKEREKLKRGQSEKGAWILRGTGRSLSVGHKGIAGTGRYRLVGPAPPLDARVQRSPVAKFQHCRRHFTLSDRHTNTDRTGTLQLTTARNKSRDKQ